MRALLESAGFRVSGRRATCIHCEGSARLTVSLTDEVAFCHRCKWTANKTTLSRKIGKEVTPETEAHRAARDKADRLEAWLNEQHKQTASEYRRLGRMAAIAKDVLSKFPECEPAWDAFAKFYHAEARLSAKLDMLTGAKFSIWGQDEFQPAS